MLCCVECCTVLRRQLPNVGKVVAQRLAAAGLGTWQALAAPGVDPRRLEQLAQKAYPFGTNGSHRLVLLF